MSKPVSHLRAIGYALASFTFWVVTDVCMKLAGEAALSPYEVVGFLGFFGVILMLLNAWRRGKIKSLWPKRPRMQLGRSLLSLFTIFCNVIALKHLPLTLFYITVFTAPMITAIMATFFLGEHLKGLKILAIVAGFAGVVVAIDPMQTVIRGDWIGYTVAFASAVAFAANMTWLRIMTQSETAQSLAFFNALMETVFGFGFMFGHVEPVSGKLFLILFMMGAFCVLGDLASYKAFRHTTATNVAQFHYTQIVTGAAFGYLIWRDIPTLHLIVGAAIIIASGLYIAARARKADKMPLMPF